MVGNKDGDFDGGINELTVGDMAAVSVYMAALERHDMGANLAKPSDPLGIGASVFLTRSLAGVGANGPWLHNGRH